ncbi:MAG: hypothetical protein WDN28_15615 [Chthoniobacter sp.]
MKRRVILMGSCLLLLSAPPLVHAQSVWNAGNQRLVYPRKLDAERRADTNIKAQINNGGTAQITAAGAAANTLYLGNGVGESGSLSVSGSGTLTINGSTGFYMVVGEAGSGHGHHFRWGERSLHRFFISGISPAPWAPLP